MADLNLPFLDNQNPTCPALGRCFVKNGVLFIKFTRHANMTPDKFFSGNAGATIVVHETWGDGDPKTLKLIEVKTLSTNLDELARMIARKEGL